VRAAGPYAGFPWPSRTLDFDGIGYRYLDVGPSEAASTVVMVHGNPTWSYFYRSLVSALAPTRRCVVPDHVGMGRSDVPPETAYDYTLARRVDDLTRLLDTQVDGPVSLVVHDWGGMVGLAWAVEHVERVERLVLLNTAAFPLLPGRRLPPSLRLARAGALGEYLVRDLNAFVLGTTLAGVRRHALAPAARQAYLAPYGSRSERLAVARFVTDIPVRARDRAFHVVQRTAERLHRLRDVPALICWGLADPVFDGDYLDEWRRYLPDAEVVALPDAGHLVLEDAADEVVGRVVRHLGAPS